MTERSENFWKSVSWRISVIRLKTEISVGAGLVLVTRTTRRKKNHPPIPLDPLLTNVRPQWGSSDVQSKSCFVILVVTYFLQCIIIIIPCSVIETDEIHYYYIYYIIYYYMILSKKLSVFYAVHKTRFYLPHLLLLQYFVLLGFTTCIKIHVNKPQQKLVLFNFFAFIFGRIS